MRDYDFAANLHKRAEDQPVQGHDFARQVFNPEYEGMNPAATGATFETPTGKPQPGMPGYAPDIAEGSGAGLVANFLAGFPEDQETKLRILAQERFPNDPNARERFGTMNGRPVFVNERGQYEYADTGVGSKVGAFASYLPEIVGGVVGSFATGNPFSGSVIGSVGGKGVKQIISGAAMDEPQTTGGNVGGLATEALVSTLGAGLGKGGSMLFNRTAVRNAEKFDLPLAEATRKRIKDATGIDLDLAQAGNIRQLRDLKKWASKYPSEAQEIIEALDSKQGAQVATAIEEKILKALSSESDPARLANSGVNAAKGAIEAAKAVRDKQVRPLYEKAYEDVVDQTTLKEILKADPVIKNALIGTHHNPGVLGDPLYKRDLAGVPQNSIKVLDLVKRRLDDQIEVAQRAGEKNRVRILAGAKNDLLTFLDAHSPAYKAARAEFAAKTRELVEPLEDGIVGTLAKIEGPEMARTAARVADDILANPNATNTVKLVLQRQDPQGWRDLVKLSLSKSFDKAAKETQSGDVVNLAGKFRQAVIGTPQRKEAMEKALGGEGVAAFNDVMDALQLIAREARNRGGSDTAFNQAITAQQKGGTLSSASRTIAAPLRTFTEMIDEGILERNSVAFAEALTDSGKLARLKELRKLRPGSERAIAVLTVMGFGVPASGLLSAPPANNPPQAQ